MEARTVKALEFLKEKLKESKWYEGHREDMEYRIEHSIRVARIGACIAEAEGMNVEEMEVACILHDVGYCMDFGDGGWLEHGRISAKVAGEFIKELGFSEERMQDMLYGIAIHVDGKADFAGRETAFANTIGDADNIDRFDVYRIYEGLEYSKFSKLPMKDKMEFLNRTLERLPQQRKEKLATATAQRMWEERIDFRILYFTKLKKQMESSLV